MTNYEVIIYYSDDDGCFIAEVPELLGCMADGKTRYEVLQNIEQIIYNKTYKNFSFYR